MIKKYVIDPYYLYIKEELFTNKDGEYFVEKNKSSIHERWCFDSVDEAKNKFVEVIQARINDFNYSITQYEFLIYRVKNSIDPLNLKDLIKKYLLSIERLLKNTLGIDDE